MSDLLAFAFCCEKGCWIAAWDDQHKMAWLTEPDATEALWKPMLHVISGIKPQRMSRTDFQSWVRALGANDEFLGMAKLRFLGPADVREENYTCAVYIPLSRPEALKCMDEDMAVVAESFWAIEVANALYLSIPPSSLRL